MQLFSAWNSQSCRKETHLSSSKSKSIHTSLDLRHKLDNDALTASRNLKTLLLQCSGYIYRGIHLYVTSVCIRFFIIFKLEFLHLENNALWSKEMGRPLEFCAVLRPLMKSCAALPLFLPLPLPDTRRTGNVGRRRKEMRRKG